jgi:hypothetical protein
MSLHEKLTAVGPKKLLALDGGGIRGLVTLEFLFEIQRLLRDATGRSDLVLADYFDYVAGTSTGAIIATCVSLGMSVESIREFYLNQGRAMFRKSPFIEQIKHRYAAANLTAILQKRLGIETTLGTDDLQTLLLLVMRNASTDSPWPLSNNPRATYNDATRADCNLKLPLWQLVRASTAAPTYFPPEVIEVGGSRFVFVDGAVTMYNNPSFLLFRMSTLEPYKLCWPTGEDKLLLISIGTGLSARANKDLKPDQMNLLYNAGSVPSALIYAASVEQDMLCRVFGKLRSGLALDEEIGNLVEAGGLCTPKLFTYMRYDVDLSQEGLDALGLKHIKAHDVQPLQQVDHLDELQTVGRVAAQHDVRLEHFAGFVDA